MVLWAPKQARGSLAWPRATGLQRGPSTSIAQGVLESIMREALSRVAALLFPPGVRVCVYIYIYIYIYVYMFLGYVRVYVYVCTYALMDGWMDGWTDRQTDR